MKYSILLILAIVNMTAIFSQSGIDTLATKDFYGAWKIFESANKICENGDSYVMVLRESLTYTSYEVNNDGCQNGNIMEFTWRYDNGYLYIVDNMARLKVLSLSQDTLTCEYEERLKRYSRIELPTESN